VLLDNQWREAGADAEPVIEHVSDLIAEQSDSLIVSHTSQGEPEDWNLQELADVIHSVTDIDTAVAEAALTAVRDANQSDSPQAARQAISEQAASLITTRFEERRAQFGPDVMQGLTQAATMRAIDTHWMDHLDTMDYLRTGIGLRGYGQRDPLVEYQKEGYLLFKQLLETIKSTIVETVFKATPTFTQAATGRQVPIEAQQTSGGQEGSAIHQLATQNPATTAGSPTANSTSNSSSTPILKTQTIGRNDPCPCGSGLKYKKCGLINAPEHR